MSLCFAVACDADSPEIAALLDLAFGPARHARPAYRLRAGQKPLGDLGAILRDEEGRLIGSAQYWRVALHPEETSEGESCDLHLLGPVVIHPDRQGQGLGRALMAHALDHADRAAVPAILLIGPAAYYSRFGFNHAPAQDWSFPGEIERARILVRVRPGVQLPRLARLGPAVP